MTVSAIERARDGSRSDLTQNSASASIVWNVFCSKTDTSEVAINTSLLPGYGDRHLHNNQLFVTKKQADQVEPGFFRVTITYENSEFADNNPGQDPFSVPPVYSWSNNQLTRDIDFDFNGEAIVNSAGEPYDPTVQIKYANAVLRVTRNEIAYDHHYAFTFINHVNADTFYGVGPGFAFVNDINASSAVTNYNGFQVFYWVVNYEIEFSSFPYQPLVLDQGFKEWPEGEDAPTNIKDAYGNDISKPALLQGDGTKAPQGYLGYWRSHPVYGTAVFSSMGI